MYKYIGSNEITASYIITNSVYNGISAKNEHHYKDCNSPNIIKAGDEGGNLDGGKWALQGVIVLTRHGDRGPFYHVKGINHINCDSEDTPMLSKYRSFVTNLTNSSSSAGLWNRLGPFHGFPLLPSTPNACLLGQLTTVGIAQMLLVGEIIRKAYMHSLDLYQKTAIKMNATETPMYNSDEIIIFSTRYRRTFQ